MVDLVLGDADQRALRSLLQVEPARGVPVPPASVLRSVLTRVRGDAIGVTVLDRSGDVVDESGVPPLDGHGHLEALDSMELGWNVGGGYAARLHVDRTHGRFGERDVAMLRLVTPVLVRLLRGGAAPFPDSLTVQERRVLGLVAEGRSNDEIGVVLGVSCSTVRKHLEHAYRKLGVHSRLAAVMVLEEEANGERSEEFA
jgi:DNA-binding CsgD family transcriptional regulator